MQLEDPPQGLKIPPKVLYFDIETALLKTTVFQAGEQWIRWQDVESDTFVMCWGAAWMHKEPLKVLSECVTPKEAKKRDDKNCLWRLWELMDDADYIVGHNMRSFDWKIVNMRFITFGWDAPFDSKIVDTLSLSRRRFRAISHSMDSWLRRWGEEQKEEMTRKDWELCLGGDEKTLKKMHRYCRNDIKRGVKIAERFEKYIVSATGKELFR